MLVDRVLVKEIANDAASDFFEIWEYPAQQPDFVHGQQRVVDALAVFHHVEDEAAGARIIAEGAVRRRQSPLDSGKCWRIQPRLLLMGLGESLDHFKRIGKLGR